MIASAYTYGLRIDSPWHRTFGPGYIDTAFHAARAADPKALLFYNDYGVEMNEKRQEKRRAATLNLLERLIKRAVPIDALGIQGHLNPFREQFDEGIFARFLKDVASLGLKIMITEFDVVDRDGPADIALRDSRVAEITRRFLDVALANSATIGVVTWGISDRYSWLSSDPNFRRLDKLPSRGLPYDGELQPKPMRQAIGAALSKRI